MHSDLGRFAGPEDREQRLNRKVGRTLACIARSFANEGHAGLALPVTGGRLKVKADDAAAGLALDHDDRRCYAQSVVVDHVAKSVEMTLHGEEFFRLHLRSSRKFIARPPREMSIPLHGDLVGMTQFQGSRVGILRTALLKSSACLGHWHVQRLAAEDKEIPAVL